MENHSYFSDLEITDEMMSLISQKGCFPYEYITDIKVLKELTSFPKK